MSGATPNHQPPEIIDGYFVSGTRHGNAENLDFWHIFSQYQTKGVTNELMVVGDNFKPARSTTYENGLVSVRAIATRANIPAQEQAAILKAIARWEQLRQNPAL